MPANHGLQLSFSHVGAFHHDVVAHHHRGGRRQVQFKILVRLVVGDGFGNGLDLNCIFLAQPGHHLLEMLSGLAVGLVHKKSDFKHAPLLFPAWRFL